MDEDVRLARCLAEEVDRAGGTAYFVGGCVRDALLGRENKDLDLEIHGVQAEKLEEILDGLGERVTMGASFGVMGLKHAHLDIAMPRSETATGRGHKDFSVFVDPFLGEEKAASRRDFTINALMQNVLTGEILDFYGGREDLEKGRIRHVNPASFGEDPLRVFRAAQFAARFGFTVAPETVELCSTMAVDALAGERVLGELEKALLKARRPSVFFEILRRMGQLSVWFPELEALIGVPQNPTHHPEGDVWTHTMQVLDEAAALREQSSVSLGFLLSALCHDFGKAETTELVRGSLHAYGHEQAGLPLAERFLQRMTQSQKLHAYVQNMGLLHMEPNKLAAAGAKSRSFMRLYDRSCCPEDLLLLARADFVGRQGTPEARAALEREYVPIEQTLREMLALYRERMCQPTVTGRDLIQAGCRPGEDFGEALDYAHKLRLAGLPFDQQLKQTLGYLISLRKKREKSGNTI